MLREQRHGAGGTCCSPPTCRCAGPSRVAAVLVSDGHLGFASLFGATALGPRRGGAHHRAHDDAHRVPGVTRGSRGLPFPTRRRSRTPSVRPVALVDDIDRLSRHVKPTQHGRELRERGHRLVRRRASRRRPPSGPAFSAGEPGVTPDKRTPVPWNAKSGTAPNVTRRAPCGPRLRRRRCRSAARRRRRGDGDRQRLRRAPRGTRRPPSRASPPSRAPARPPCRRCRPAGGSPRAGPVKIWTAGMPRSMNARWSDASALPGIDALSTPVTKLPAAEDVRPLRRRAGAEHLHLAAAQAARRCRG